MDENKVTRAMIPGLDESGLLSLLRAEVLDEATTVTIYTSRKSRVWVCARTFQPRNFSTAVECRVHGSLETLLSSLAACLMAHFLKQQGAATPEDTWLPWQDLGNVSEEAQAFIAAWKEDMQGPHDRPVVHVVTDSDGVIMEPPGGLDQPSNGKKSDNTRQKSSSTNKEA